MKILIWCDIEGISGIDDPENGFADDNYKHLATAEINSVIKGIKKGGATEIDIFDGHGMGDNQVGLLRETTVLNGIFQFL